MRASCSCFSDSARHGMDEASSVQWRLHIDDNVVVSYIRDSEKRVDKNKAFFYNTRDDLSQSRNQTHAFELYVDATCILSSICRYIQYKERTEQLVERPLSTVNPFFGRFASIESERSPNQLPASQSQHRRRRRCGDLPQSPPPIVVLRPTLGLAPCSTPEVLGELLVPSYWPSTGDQKSSVSSCSITHHHNENILTYSITSLRTDARSKTESRGAVTCRIAIRKSGRSFRS